MKNIATYLVSEIVVVARQTTKRAGLWSYALVIGMLAGQAVGQTTYTWTSTVVGTYDWTVGANWTNSTPFVSGSGNELKFFPGSSVAAANIVLVGTITITNVPSAFSMNTLTLNGCGPNGGAVSYMFIGNNTSTWTIGDGATALINLNSGQGGGHAGLDDLRYTVAPNITLINAVTTFTGSGFSMSGYNFSGNITGSGCGITKQGSSRLTFSGSNTYSGTTAVNAGQLRLNSVNAIPGGIGVSGGISALTINGGMVELNASDLLRNLGTGSSQFQITGGTSGFSAKGALRLVIVNGDATQTLTWGTATFRPTALVLNNADADNTIWLANKVDLNGTTRTIQVDANTAVVAGNIQNSSGTAGITKTGSGTLVLSGANTYNGPTTNSAGTLIVGTTNNLGLGGSLVCNGGTLRITGTSITNMASLGHAVTFTATKTVGFDIENAANTFTVDQVLNQTTGGLYKDGAGALVLNQDNTFTGATTATGGGTLVLDYTTNNGRKLSNTPAALSLTGSALVLKGGSYTEMVASTTLGTSGNSISRDGGTSKIALGGLQVPGGGGVTYALAIAAPGTGEPALATTTSANVNGILPLGRVTVGSDFAAKDGSGNITNYTGYTTATTAGGSLGTQVCQLTGGGSLGAELNFYALKIVNDANSNVLNLNGKVLRFVNDTTLLYAGGGGWDNNYTISGSGSIQTVNGGDRWVHFNTYTGTTLRVDVIISTPAGIAKAGAGTLVLGPNVANSFPGVTYIQQGVLRVTHNASLGGIGGGTIVQGGAALELTNNITVGAEALTIAGAGITHSGALRNLAGNNTYGGAITVAGGGARINADSGTLTLTGGIATTGGQDLTFGGAGNITVSTNGIRGAANLIKDGAGTLELVITDSAVQSSCGDMTLNASTFQLTFAVAPSATVSPIKIMGDLNFSGTPTIRISVNPVLFTKGVAYPLLTVSGSKPETPPVIEVVGATGTVQWVGKTLFLVPPPQGSIILFN